MMTRAVEINPGLFEVVYNALLQAGPDEAKIIAAQVAEQTESELVDVRGHTFLLFKRKKKQ